MLRVAKDSRRAAVLQKLRNLVGMQGSVERHDHAARSNRSQISRHPSRMIVGKQRHPRTAWELLLRDPPAHGFGHPPEFRVGAGFNVVATLEFQGYVVGPALGAVHKAVVERGHGSWGIYTKSTTGRSALSDARPATTGEHRGTQGKFLCVLSGEGFERRRALGLLGGDLRLFRRHDGLP